jgi:stress-induced morphogen
MNRKFGAELEMIGITREQAVRALRSVNINVRDESYNHQTRDYWKIVPDGSVSGGFEVVSPILEGETGLEQLRIVATALDDMGGNVNRSCGYHVHFDAAGMDVAHIRSIVTRYAAFEAEIDAFMPASRRGGVNTYCKSMREFAASERFRDADTLRGLIGAQGGRYFKVNLQAHHAHGTIEFRQHSGTLNAAKAVNWVRFLDAFITESIARVDAPVAAPVQIPALRGVLGQLAELFRQGDVTLDTMVERFGWQAHSARAAVTRLRKAGMDIICGTGNVYALRSGTAQARQEDSLWAGIADSLRTFYHHRAAVLSAAA